MLVQITPSAERELEPLGRIHISKANKFREIAFCSEKAMAPHSSVLAWRISGMEEPGGLPTTGLHRVGHD